ncbi:MAG: orotidine-5'-phosphate decarboxylase [Spirochaetales bacterium]|nr:orotidine-5'-phosphate decarboxylase [Spirochaetales bacterium]
MKTDFFSGLTTRIAKTESILCIGIDPQHELDPADIYTGLLEWCKKLIDRTHRYAACYKPNIAFFEAWGHEGLRALKDVIASIPDDIPVIVDAKRSDIGNTAKAYAASLFKHFGADAVTLNPYLGRESVQPFLEYSGRGLFLLCRTSNPGAGAIQELSVSAAGDEPLPLYLRIAGEAASWSEHIGLVVAGNDPGSLEAVRSMFPHIWILSPGIGAQGGDAEAAVRAGIRNDGGGLIINVSRSIACADDPAKKAEAYHGQFRAILSKHKTDSGKKGSTMRDEKRMRLVKRIIDNGCFRTGSFTLKSGLVSPFYIDLRLLIADAALLSDTASAYIEIIRTLRFSRIAGIPFAGIPIATVIAQKLNAPMIFPRLQKKEHGSGNMIEGAYEKGEEVVLVDDLITTGKSKFEALDILEEAGLVVRDLVVLIERGSSGRKELDERGVRLHSCFRAAQFVRLCHEGGCIRDEVYKAVIEFLEKT